MKTNIYVIYGGKSAEHDVSLRSALNVINALNKEKYDVYPIYITQQGVWCSYGRVDSNLEYAETLRLKSRSGDAAASLGGILIRYLSGEEQGIIFPVIHGTYGEDGTLQGLLELLNVPYVGNGVFSSAAAMDKAAAKRIFADSKIPQVKYHSFLRQQWLENSDRCRIQVEEEIGYPCYVKPANLGSSVGISRCEDRAALYSAVETALEYDHKLIVEKEVIGREIQLAVLGNNNPVCSVAGEFIREKEFFDYHKKYIAGNLIQRIPAAISDEVYAQLRDIAIKAFNALDGFGLMRVDFFVTDGEEVFLNEVNTLPGFTSSSMFPVLWLNTDGTTYSNLLDKLIELAQERHKQKQIIKFGMEV